MLLFGQERHTPFKKAVLSRSVSVVEVLLMFGADPNLKDWVCSQLNNKKLAVSSIYVYK